MPYKSERIPIAGTNLDQRRKLSNEQRRAIKILADNGYSQRKLAAMFNVSKSLVQTLLAQIPKTRQKKKRPTAYWTEAKRKYRQRKQQLYKEGILNGKRKTKKNR